MMKLTPLIICTTHTDPTTYQFLNEHLDFFYVCGYKKICIEFGSDLSAMECIKKRESDIRKYSAIVELYLDLTIDAIEKMHIDTVAKLFKEKLLQQPLDYITQENFSGVVYDLKKIPVYIEQVKFLNKANQSFEIIPSDMPHRTIDNVTDPQREKSLLTKFNDNSLASDGGTIMIVGLDHLSTFKALNFPYLSCHLYNSNCDKTFLTRISSIILTETREKNKVDFSADLANTSSLTIFDQFANRVTKEIKAFEKSYLKHSTIDLLNNRVTSSFKAYLRYGNCIFVDAATPFASIDHCQKIRNELNANPNFSVPVEIKEMENAKMIVVENINDPKIAEAIWKPKP